MKRERKFRWRALLVAAGLVVLGAPIVFGQTSATPQSLQTTEALASFEVASIKPSKSGDSGHAFRAFPERLSITDLTLHSVIARAFHVEESQVLGGPHWLDSERYDIEAKPDSTVTDKLRKLNPDQRFVEIEHMIQPLLAERFLLKYHREKREFPVYWLEVVKPGKIPEDDGECDPSSANLPLVKQEPGKLPPAPCGALAGIYLDTPTPSANLIARKIPIDDLIAVLPRFTERLVLDKTGLTGKYDIQLNFDLKATRPDFFEPLPGGAVNSVPGSLPADAEGEGPSIFRAIQEQLGLKLVPGKGPVEVIVIDQVKRPTEN